MATVIRTSALATAAAALLAGCGDLQGFGGDVPPLATVQLEVTGDLAPLRPPDTEGETPALRVALLWGAQWWTEPFCILPPESDEAAAVIAAGCRDPFGFVPDRVAANVAVEPGVPATMTLDTLPAADVMVGDVTARVAYASLVVYDDRDGSGTLELLRARRGPTGGMGPPDMGGDFEGQDVVYGASFASMTRPDQRLAYREGAFALTAFYPRSGCGAPLPGFSIVAAGGFTAEAALAATAMGRLPDEDPASCAEASPDDAVVTIPLVAPAGVQEVRCTERRDDSTVRYRQPTTDPPDLTGRTLACAHLPSFGGAPASDQLQLVVSSQADAPCQGLTHYVLRGCRDGTITCDVPEWDFTATPPAWWPCPAQAAR